MADGWLYVVTLVAAIGCGLNAGVFFAFSAFVMPALARLGPQQGIAAMQSINLAAVTPAFMIALFGTAAACLVLAVAALLAPDRPAAIWLLAGAVSYLAGGILVTVVCNVPRNDRLARTDAAANKAVPVWADYLVSWTAWNHVRAASCLAAAGALTLALRSMR
jgi:uncharacterized membrane protein